jgi:thiamine phosphate synthase YjbQ (UPF0047 family)
MRWNQKLQYPDQFLSRFNPVNIFETPRSLVVISDTGRRWEDDIKRNLEEIQCEDSEWIHLAQDRDQWKTLMSTVINHQIQKTRGGSG